LALFKITTLGIPKEAALFKKTTLGIRKEVTLFEKTTLGIQNRLPCRKNDPGHPENIPLSPKQTPPFVGPEECFLDTQSSVGGCFVGA